MTMTVARSYTNERSGSSETASPNEQRIGDFVNSLQDAVRENPVPAALIGMGVLWMFMGGSKTSLFGGDGRKSIFRTAMRGAEQVGNAVRDTGEHASSTLSRAADVAAGTSQATDAVRQASAAVRNAASRTASQAADAVSSAYDATTHVASRAAETVSNATMTATATGAKWGTNLSDLFDRQPLLLGAVGLAIGAGIAASVPTTEAEKKVMGEASDFIRDTVTEKAAQVKDMADAALQEVRAQGLTPEAAGKALNTLGEKVGALVL
jgi:hypothetical protein